MKLYEVFDKPVDWSWHDDSMARFVVGNMNYEITFDEHTLEHPDFNVNGKHVRVAEVVFAAEVNSHTPDEEKSIGLTNTGNAVFVFATVIQIMSEYADHAQNINGFVFRADEPSRVRLYTRIVKSFTTKGWHSLPQAHGQYMVLRNETM
jgi:hypothetical protein